MQYSTNWAGLQRKMRKISGGPAHFCWNCKKKLPGCGSFGGKSASGVANVDQRDGVGAGVGGDDAAQREDDERVFAEGFAAGPDEVVLLGDVGVTDHIIEVLHALAALFGQLDHGGHDLVVAAHLGLHLGFAVDEGDDGADAHQLTHDGGRGGDAAALLHLLEAEGAEDDLDLVHLRLKLVDDVADLRAVLQLAGHLAHIPAEGHGIGVRVQQVDLQVVLRALFAQHPLRHDGVVVGGGAGTVDGHMDDVRIAFVHVLAVFFAELQRGDGGGGRDALCRAHFLVKLCVGAALPLHIVHIIQQDVEAHNVNAVFLGQLLRDVAGGIGQDRDLAHNVPHFHS